ncbi:hypothetical protein GCM10018790_39160 [Kitasatospora xanthocidica]|uniref:hypothetical protein n=1 Tax=Kitasatospora xanthocidica TaxID=83382 RepID=UPI001679E646|nr:hypothetical protein [Kitasatospora xanthocidica]GHF57300.1 hypothetical protein GCM10018790_39160 [Kitasatospora xanthocidica]
MKKTKKALRNIAMAAATTALAIAGTMTATGTAEAAVDRGDGSYISIYDDEPLYKGWHLDAGTTRAIMQDDGNFVVYQPSRTTFQITDVLASNTVGRGYKAVMQSDGNFVVYDAGNNALWSTGTWGHPHARLTVHASGRSGVYWGGGIIPRSSTTGPGTNAFYLSSDLY